MTVKRLLLTVLVFANLSLFSCKSNVRKAEPVVREHESVDSVDSGRTPEETLPGGDTTQTAKSEPYKGFVYVRDYIPDLVEELRYNTSNNFMGEPANGYKSNRVILSKEAALALKAAADEFRQMGYVIKVYDAYRPQSAVDHFVRWSKTSDQRNKDDYYPTLSKTSLFPRYIAKKSGHSKGSTIDMTICYKDTGKEVDMGSHFDFFGTPSHTMFLGSYAGGTVTKEHQKSRLLLRSIMTKHGFKPYDNEWWHFTLKNEPYPQRWFNFPVE